jgi:hydrogenase-4 membrane subunit HyfE
MQFIELIQDTLSKILILLSFLMGPLALFCITAGSIRQMINWYRAQSWVLALLTLVNSTNLALTRSNGLYLLLLLCALFPAFLAVYIERVLAQATVRSPEPEPFFRRFLQPVERSLPIALLLWLRWGLPTDRRVIATVVSLLLSALSAAVALELPPSWSEQSLSANIGVAIALSLVLLGIFTMVTRGDLISQLVGLLVMDHGIYLGVVRLLVSVPMVVVFVAGLLAYTLVTLLILFYLTREVQNRSGTIGVSAQRTLSESETLERTGSEPSSHMVHSDPRLMHSADNGADVTTTEAEPSVP